MARLRIRIELNRGGVGVPLRKFANLVDEAKKFLHLLAEDIQIDQTKGNWLGFDFGNESLNFTAEFVGPVTVAQVAAFHAAFDGTTSLRRITIAQFARITATIEQDERIGFGLYLSDDDNEPSEWRGLSPRDALRITDEIQMLSEASGEVGGYSGLPAVNTSVGAHLFSDRHERTFESTRWVDYLREVESSMDRRISHLENVVQGQSGLIEDLHLKSVATEESVHRLLSAVEDFCAQTTLQIEAITAPVVPSPIAPSPVAPEATQQPQPPAEAAITPPAVQPEPAPVSATETVSQPDPPSIKTSTASSWLTATSPALPPRTIELTAETQPVQLATVPTRDWRIAAGLAFLGIVVVIFGVWAWKNPFAKSPVQSVDATSGFSINSPAATPNAQPKSPAGPTQTAPPASPNTGAHVNLEASEFTWVSLRDAHGNLMLARLFVPGETYSFDSPNGAILRVGNASGVKVFLNGNAVGSLGLHGKVREIVFANGSYKLVPTD